MSKSRRKKKPQPKRWVVPAVSLAVALAIGGALFAGSTSGSERNDPDRDPEAAATIEYPSLGDTDAPVTMIEYADFQCPFCGKFARETEPELIERYVDTGVLRLEWRDFPYLGEESTRAALAARAAQEQGLFWEYHDAAYEAQGSPNSGTFSDDKLLEIARDIELDMTAFEDAFLSQKYKEAVEQAFRAGQDAGVTGTPTFVINGRIVVGAQPLEVFVQAIEAAAQAAS